ncbi:MAG: DUF817 domain-containing protein, partial [Deltaproteobacteria bacterium]|nr:DUF817 domain-containing protein [Deltaproteobacteria bacterium]
MMGAPENRLHRGRAAGSVWAQSRGWWAVVGYELLVFAIKQAWACVFGAALLALLLATHLFYPEHAVVARYDFLVLAAVGLQLLLLATGLETRDEAMV